MPMSMRRIWIWIVFLTGFGWLYATPTMSQSAYERALEEIEKVQDSGDTFLNLSYFSLDRIPPEIGDLTQLRSLNIGYNDLTSLPPEITKLIHLEWLSIDHNEFTDFPVQLSKLTTLRELALASNKLTSIPAHIGQMTQLRELI